MNRISETNRGKLGKVSNENMFYIQVLSCSSVEIRDLNYELHIVSIL